MTLVHCFIKLSGGYILILLNKWILNPNWIAFWIDTDMLGTFLQTKALAWHLSMHKRFNIHFCSMILVFLSWVRFKGLKLPSATGLQTQSWTLSVRWDWIRHPGMLFICSGLVIQWCMHILTSSLDMLFSR